MKELIASLRAFLPEEDVLENESMALHTTFRAGGAARVFVRPHSTEDLKQVLSLTVRHDTPYTVIGNGSNLLVSDDGYEGVVVCVRGMGIAGMMNSEIASRMRDAGQSGFEFAAGIPGTLGGAVIMNAGAYGGEMKDIVTRVDALHVLTDGTVEEVSFSAEEMQFAYRTSRLKNDSSYVVTAAHLALTPDDPETIAKRMKELAEKRKEKQPLEFASAGSTFKRPEGHFAGALIEAAGCKGLSVGDAQVSEKHAGFLINRGNASALQIHQLMREVMRRVYENSGVTLEPEIVLLGSFPGQKEALCDS